MDKKRKLDKLESSKTNETEGGKTLKTETLLSTEDTSIEEEKIKAKDENGLKLDMKYITGCVVKIETMKNDVKENQATDTKANCDTKVPLISSSPSNNKEANKKLLKMAKNLPIKVNCNKKEKYLTEVASNVPTSTLVPSPTQSDPMKTQSSPRSSTSDGGKINELSRNIQLTIILPSGNESVMNSSHTINNVVHQEDHEEGEFLGFDYEDGSLFRGFDIEDERTNPRSGDKLSERLEVILKASGN